MITRATTYLILIILVVTLNISAVNCTFTIDVETLANIRTAIINDPLIYEYWGSYSRSTREDDPELPEYGDRAFTNSFGLEALAINTYQALILNDPSNYLSTVRIKLLHFPWKTYERALHHPSIAENIVPNAMLSGEWPRPTYWQNTHESQNNPAWYRLNAYQRGRELSYNLMFLTFMIDMLYCAYDDSDPYAADQMYSILTKYNEHLHWIRESFFTDNQAVWDTLGWQRDASTVYPIGICCDDYPSDDDGSAYRMPMIGNDVNRYVLMCGLGYGAIVTGMHNPANIDFNNSSSLINFVKHEFVSDTEYPVGSGCYGMDDYLVTKTGMYVGGITYQNRMLYLTPLFLTALNRVYGINLYNSSNAWNCDLVPKMVKNVLVRIDPELHHILQEDDWRYDGIDEDGNYNPPPYIANHSVQIERGLLPFYYQNTDEADTRENIRWYVNRLMENNGGVYPRETWEHDLESSFMVVMSYRAGADGIGGDAAVPEHYINRNYTNGELTILRSPLTDQEQGYLTSDFKDMNMMTINHENSFTFAHKNDDKTSYQLYLEGKPLIIEGGYRPDDSWKDWFRSASSHNLLIVNPDFPRSSGTLNEDAYLGLRDPEEQMSFEDPSSPLIYKMWQEFRDDPEAFNPAQKEYLFSNGDISHLKVSVRYRNSMSTSYDHNDFGPQNDYPCEVERNFYSIADKYYLVLDRVQQLETRPEGNVYKNQLHFLDDPVNGYEMVYLPDRTGVFKHNYPSSSLYVAMGTSASVDSYSIRNNLPLGWRSWDWTIGKRQQRIFLKTTNSTNSQDKFITFLYPGSPSACPITETVISPGTYGIITQTDTSMILAAINSGAGVLFPSSQYQVNTNASFFTLETDALFTDVDNLIIHGGNSISIQSTVNPNSPVQILLSSDSDSCEEIIGNWKNNSLYVTTRSQNPLFPRFKILRCGVLHENLFSKTEYGTDAISIDESTPSTRGCISNNIQNLAYDDQYFYVNYSWEQLETEGIMNDGLVIVKGSIPETTLVASISFQGQINVEGDVTLPDSESLNILPGSQVTFANDTGINVFGTLSIEGGEERSVSLGSMNQQWTGILVHSAGSFTCSGAVIESAKTGVLIRGAVSITDCEIKNCQQGASIETATPFAIENSQIHDNDYGIMVSNNYTTSESGYVKNNEICQNGIGILLYNSNPLISLNDIHSNYQAGLYFVRGSDPIVTDCNISYTEQNGYPSPEIRLESESYPILDNGGNDINADGQGYSLCYASTGKINSMAARKNYWGCTNSLGIRQWIYPQAWDLTFEPFCMEANTSFLYVDDMLFLQALTAEKNGDLSTARQLYSTIVATEPDSLYALQSLSRLNSIYSSSPQLLSDLRSLFDAYTLACSDSNLVKTAQIKKVMLDRIDGLYLDALHEYEDHLDQSATELDSLLCRLDIAYTLQDMYYDDQGKGSVAGTSYHANGLQVSSLKDAKGSIDLLWDQILNSSDNPILLNVPVPTTLELSNYPNPFNPSTTVAFSLPVDGIVRLSVYNIRGQLVRELINGSMPRGFHKVVWDGRDNGNRSVSSGLYYIRIETGKASTARKMLLLK